MPSLIITSLLHSQEKLNASVFKMALFRDQRDGKKKRDKCNFDLLFEKFTLNELPTLTWNPKIHWELKSLDSDWKLWKISKIILYSRLTSPTAGSFPKHHASYRRYLEYPAVLANSYLYLRAPHLFQGGFHINYIWANPLLYIQSF